MSAETEIILPYRVDGADLEKLVEHRARGRSLEQIRTLGFSQKGFEGTRRAAEVLGLLTGEGGLTEAGKTFALAREVDERRELVLKGMMDFEPYALLLTSLLADGAPEMSELSDIELWWSTHGYGNSESNRESGSTALARLSEYAGLGNYILGRGGHPSRIRWVSGAPKMVRAAEEAVWGSASVEGEGEQQQAAARDSDAGAGTNGADGPPPGPARSGPGALTGELPDFSIQIPLGPLSSRRVAYLYVPSDLRSDEKQRLKQALDFLLVVEESEVTASTRGITGEEDQGREVK